MAIKNIIAKGIGFTPATLKWIPTHGFSSGAVASTQSVLFHMIRAQNRGPHIVRGQNRDPLRPKK